MGGFIFGRGFELSVVGEERGGGVGWGADQPRASDIWGIRKCLAMGLFFCVNSRVVNASCGLATEEGWGLGEVSTMLQGPQLTFFGMKHSQIKYPPNIVPLLMIRIRHLNKAPSPIFDQIKHQWAQVPEGSA